MIGERRHVDYLQIEGQTDAGGGRNTGQQAIIIPSAIPESSPSLIENRTR